MRSDRFYGREPELAEILRGPRDSIWLVGRRKIGKTAVLRQAETRAAEAASGYQPLYWSMADAADLESLHARLMDAIEDAPSRAEAPGIDPAGLRGDDLFTTLRAIARQLQRRQERLLLLCDQAEALIAVYRDDTSALRRLGRALRAGGNVRIVLASTVGLWELAEEKGVSTPFLVQFTPPLYLGPLEAPDAEEMASAGDLDSGTAAEICRRSGRHPWLVRRLRQRCLETADLEEAVEWLSTDGETEACFRADVATLSQRESLLLESLRWSDATESPTLVEDLGMEAAAVGAALQRLERLGFVLRGEESRYRLSSEILDRWLQRQTKQRAEAISRSLEQPPSARLLGLVYDELHDQARRYMNRERVGHTLQPTALVNEAYLRLSDQSRVSWQGRTHFLAMGAAMMRRVLVDHARGRKRIKRGAEWQRVTLSDWLEPADKLGLDRAELLALDRALAKLAEENERQARIVEMRFFGGLKVDEVAEALGVSKRTVEGDWSRARKWLNRELSQENGENV